ncbi:MAG: aldehyde ferredoxin oxidoreductase family protein [Chloroflexi bacterium]|nr:aldehyde ferredoxin oxidoreductase family protein [Chloroflexota bacterium]
MAQGFTGKILHVDLTERRTWIEEPDEAFYRKMMGGRALVAHYLLKLVPRGADPLGPENVLIMAPGIVTGSTFSGQGRNGFGAKSPLTGGIGSAEAGGYAGSELKRAGFDAVIVHGKASSPVYLWIKDGEVEIRDGSAVWGLEIGPAQDKIREEIGDKGARTSLIGPAGENLVRFSCIVNDLAHFAGRTGLGAVMGSKNLKGFAIKAKGALPVADKKPSLDLSKWMTQNLDLTWHFHDVGTAGGLRALHLAGGLPTFNFQEGEFAGNEKITGTTMRDTILIKRDTCYACAVRCKRVVEVEDTERNIKVNPMYGGPEYESLSSLGNNCGVDDLIALAKANERTAALGLDSISTGMVIAWAMEAFEKGLLTADDTGGVELKFGDAEALMRAVDIIASREGPLGDLLAEGSKRAADKIGRGTQEFVMHVKGQEFPLHEPRIKHALGVGYSVSPTGADHMHNMHDTAATAEGPFMDRMREYNPDFKTIHQHGFDENKSELHWTFTTWRHFCDSVGLCHFLPYSPSQMMSVVNGMTGWDTDIQELLTIGQRAATLARIFNLREGLDSSTDVLPKRMFGPFRNDASATGKPLDPEELQRARLWYYHRSGWDESGVPTPETLRALGLEEYESALPVEA